MHKNFGNQGMFNIFDTLKKAAAKNYKAIREADAKRLVQDRVDESKIKEEKDKPVPPTPQTQKTGEGEKLDASEVSMEDHSEDKEKDKKKEKDETGTRTMQAVDDKSLEQKQAKESKVPEPGEDDTEYEDSEVDECDKSCRRKKKLKRFRRKVKENLYLCNKCSKTFRANESKCPKCGGKEVEAIVLAGSKSINEEENADPNQPGKTKKVYRVDIDGILTVETEGEDYSKRTPNKENIEMLNKLNSEGAEVILWTHRSEKDRKVTEDWLVENGVEYNEIEFDKPEYDAIIDDRCNNLESLVSKKSGEKEIPKEEELEEKPELGPDEELGEPGLGESKEKKLKECTDKEKGMFDKEKKEHPSFTDEQVWQIVKDHIKLGESVNESKLSEQEKDTRIVVAKGILDKAEADKLAKDKKGAVIQDEEDPKKWMVIVKESKIVEKAGRKIVTQIGEVDGKPVEVEEDRFLNALSRGIDDSGYGYWFSGESKQEDKMIFEFTSSTAPKLELIVYGKVVEESKVKETEGINNG